MFLAVTPFFFFNDTATTEIYTLSLHDALPIWLPDARSPATAAGRRVRRDREPGWIHRHQQPCRSEEHTSELQSRLHLVCRLLLEKKKSAFDDRLHTSIPQSYVVTLARQRVH